MAEFAKLASPRYAFGDFVLERSQQEVRRRDGSLLNLSPRLFNALLLFVEHAGELLDKDALMRALWPGLVVDENSLSQVVSGLRRALADDPVASRYIQTVPRRGFRFIATVTDAARTRRRPRTTRRQRPEESLQRDSMPPSDGAGTARARNRRSGPTPAERAPRRGGTGCTWHVIGGAAASLGARGAVGVAPGAALRQRGPTLDAGRAAFQAAGGGSARRAAGSGHGRQPDRAAVHRARAGRSLGRLGAPLRRHRAGPAARGARARRGVDRRWLAAAAWRPVARHRAPAAQQPTGVAAWTGTFDEKFTGVFEVQDAISARVAKVLAPSLEVFAGARPSAVPGLGGTRNTDAYQLYLAAARYAQDMRADGLRKSIGAVPPGAGHRPRLCPGLGRACRNASADAVRHRRQAIGRIRAGGRGDPARPRPGPGSGRSACRAGVQALLVRLRLARCRARVPARARDQSERGRGPLRSGEPAAEPGPARRRLCADAHGPRARSDVARVQHPRGRLPARRRVGATKHGSG